MANEQIEHAFRYHPPKPEMVGRYQALRELARRLAVGIEELCPEGREKSLAVTRVEEAVMWANAAIARAK